VDDAGIVPERALVGEGRLHPQRLPRRARRAAQPQPAQQTDHRLHGRARAQRTNIASLKIRFNHVFGYYIEISRPNLHLAPADYERKQTLVNAERFTSTELKEYGAQKSSPPTSASSKSSASFSSTCAPACRKSGAPAQDRLGIAQLDVLASSRNLAPIAVTARPEFTFHRRTPHRCRRHPVIEELLRQSGERFVPNDLFSSRRRQQLLLITGPNMGGKSTYLRQAGAHRLNGADRLLRSRTPGQAAIIDSHLHAHRRQRQSRPRPLHVSRRNVRSRRHPQPRHACQPRSPR